MPKEKSRIIEKSKKVLSILLISALLLGFAVNPVIAEEHHQKDRAIWIKIRKCQK